MAEEGYSTYAQIKERLDEIVEAAKDDGLPIDDALSLYEEAVRLGLAASDLIEQDIEARDAADAQNAPEEADSLERAAETGASSAAVADADAGTADGVAPDAR